MPVIEHILIDIAGSCWCWDGITDMGNGWWLGCNTKNHPANLSNSPHRSPIRRPLVISFSLLMGKGYRSPRNHCRGVITSGYIVHIAGVSDGLLLPTVVLSAMNRQWSVHLLQSLSIEHKVDFLLLLYPFSSYSWQRSKGRSIYFSHQSMGGTRQKGIKTIFFILV